MKKLVISVLLANLLVACASEKTKAPTVESKPASTIEAPASGTTSEAPATSTVTTPATQVDPLDDPNSILAKRSVYYPFDVSVVQPEYIPLVQAHAQYLRDHETRKVRLEGNCDERGSTEYNLALGQRRADGVKKMMEAGGVNDDQIVTLSYGEEKPRALGHNEDAWAQNRRTDLNYNFQ